MTALVPPAPSKAVTYQRKDTAHTFHIFMSFITGGAWFLLVYGPLLLIRMKKRKIVTYYQ